MGNTHRVKKGDTLTALAKKFGVSIRWLVKRNHIENPNLIIVGQKLRVPDRFRSAPGAKQDKSAESPAPAKNPAALPPGVDVRFDGTAKVMTLNVHKMVPGYHKFRTEGPGSNESKRVLKDIADFINAQNPDIVILQELDNDLRGKQAKHGVPEQLRRLAERVGATGSAMATHKHYKSGNGFDNALITRNGFTIDENVSVKLPGHKRAKNDTQRSVGIADVLAPDQKTHLSVFYTHTTAHRDKGAVRARKKQLSAIADLVRRFKDGVLRVFDINQNQHVTLRTTRNAATIVGGDLNAGTRFTDRLLEKVRGLRNIIDLAPDRERADDRTFLSRKGNPKRRLDHLYVKGLEVADAHVEAVTPKRVALPTDHAAVIAEVKFR